MSHGGRRAGAVVAAIAAVVSGACAGAPPIPPSNRAVLVPCRLDGLPEEVRCGTLRVPEDRRAPQGRAIDLRFAVVPALSATPARDPLFLLAGGPGQAASLYAPWVLSVFRSVRRDRDLVLVDQRGTGKSHPLDCESEDGAFSSLSPLSPEEARACLAGLDADPRHYTNEAAMDDLDEVRNALGYDQINLWGGSYGTRAALVYLQKHPSRVRAAVLDGVAPFSVRFPLYTARDGQRALDLLLADCEKDPTCSAVYPDLRQVFAALLRGLERAPAQVTVRDPRTGSAHALTISREALGVAVRGFLYAPSQASLVPWVLSRAARGDYAPFVALYQAVAGWSFDTMSLGMTLSVLCSEDVPRIRPEDAAESTRDTFVGPSEISRWQRLCAEWPRAELPAAFFEPASRDVPVLILSGGLDPVTPPHWGDEVAALFPRSLHAVAQGAGHNVSPWGCAPDLMADFLRRGAAQGLDATCLDRIRRPAFFVPAGPAIAQRSQTSRTRE